MIQRLQSFLLVLAAVGIVLMFMYPVATYIAPYNAPNGETIKVATSELNLFAKSNPDLLSQIDNGGNIEVGQAETGFHSWPLIVLAGIIGIIALVSIFFYKNRVLQMRIVAIGGLLNVVYIALVFLWAVDGYAKAMAHLVPGAEIHAAYSVGTWTPIATCLLLLFAQQRIKKDEEKVRAADRLR